METRYERRVISTSSSDDQQTSPSDRTHLMSHTRLKRNPSAGIERGRFSSPRLAIEPMSGVRGFPSPRIFPRITGETSRTSVGLVRSVSEDHVINLKWNAKENKKRVHREATSMIVGSSGSTMEIENQLHQTGDFIRPDDSVIRTSLMSEPKPTNINRSESASSDVRAGSLLSRSSTRRSFGREWTRSHWEKVRDLEQESERARRCSKLSSGFAPLMVFGGLVFICIGVSATTNTGKDREKLQSLSAAPMVMGVFMLALGIFLIISWFGCRGRAKGLEQQLLHGSRRSSIETNVVQSLLSKLYTTTGIRRETSSPILPGVTLDGVDVLKPEPDNGIRRDTHRHLPSNTSGCCRQCGAANTTAQAILETAM